MTVTFKCDNCYEKQTVEFHKDFVCPNCGHPFDYYEKLSRWGKFKLWLTEVLYT